jgi:GTP-binding protein
MIIKSAVFAVSSPSVSKCPETKLKEVAFIGRSNVGKSSLINMLTGKSGLAKTSATPGKTQLINHFLINEKWYLVDLPGYGYAKLSKTKREEIDKMIKNYLDKRENLVCTFVLIDSRHEPQPADVLFLNWLGERQIPFVIIFTKADKLTKGSLQRNLNAYKAKLRETWEELPEIFVSSSETGEGKSEILDFIKKIV